MYDLTKLNKMSADGLGADLRKLGEGARTMEEAANRMVKFLYENICESAKNKSCALVRFYKTHRFEDLNAELRGFAQGILGRSPSSPDMKCLVLLATAGDKDNWNARAKSSGHKAIPLPDEEFVAKIPMISRLVSQFGLDVNAVVKPDPNLIADLEQKTYNAFHVAEAVGSPYIPAQKDFVIPNGIRSVLGFGGMLPNGDLFTLILFAKVSIPRQTADLAGELALSAKQAIQPFVRGRIFASASAAA